jgi:hypothetical protein
MYQMSIEFFYPLTEQIPLELNYEGCAKPKLVYSDAIGQTLNFNNGPTWTTTAIQPELKVTPTNSVGYLSIGAVSVGLKKKPTWLQKHLHKLLGFDWKDTQ